MIIIAGDSWSDPNWYSDLDPDFDNNFPKWFDLLNTDKKVKSIAASGAGQDWMFTQIMNEIQTNSEVKCIVWALSDWLRFRIGDRNFNPQLSYKVKQRNGVKNQYQSQNRLAYEQNRICDITRFDDEKVMDEAIDKNYTYLAAISEVCRARGIKLVIFQMLYICKVSTFYNYRFTEKFFKHRTHKYLPKLGAELIGWPFVPELGGETVDDLLFESEPVKHAWRVGNGDMHPNDKGHKFIAEWVNSNVQFD